MKQSQNLSNDMTTAESNAAAHAEIESDLLATIKAERVARANQATQHTPWINKPGTRLVNGGKGVLFSVPSPAIAAKIVNAVNAASALQHNPTSVGDADVLSAAIADGYDSDLRDFAPFKAGFRAGLARATQS